MAQSESHEGSAVVPWVLAHVTPAIKNKIYLYKRNFQSFHWNGALKVVFWESEAETGEMVEGGSYNDKYE